jgi:hypothetical protein
MADLKGGASPTRSTSTMLSESRFLQWMETPKRGIYAAGSTSCVMSLMIVVTQFYVCFFSHWDGFAAP